MLVLDEMSDHNHHLYKFSSKTISDISVWADREPQSVGADSEQTTHLGLLSLKQQL